MSLFNTNSAGVVAAIAALDDKDHQRRSLVLAQRVKTQLMNRLPNYGLSPVPSEANFVWVNVKKDCRPLVQRLARQGVFVAGGQRWDLPQYLRISVGQTAEMAKFFRALET
jgi:histidinol-phosphate aminotransferase